MKKTFYTIFGILLATLVYSQAGELDLAFNGDGVYIKDFNGDGYANCLSLQNDGKVIIGGYLSGSNDDLLLMRLDNYGNPDLSFGIQGSVILDYQGDDEEIQTIKVASSGSIYTFAQCDSANVEGALITKFTSSGQVDLSYGVQGHQFIFGPSSATQNKWYDMALLADGSVLIIGDITENSVGKSGAIFKLNPQGFIDLAFGNNGFVSLQNNGIKISFRRVELTGSNHFFALGTTTQQGDLSLYLAKFDGSGNLITSFGGNGVVVLTPSGAPFPRDLMIKPDGKLLLTMHGYINGWSAISTIQLLSTGLLDQSYGTNGRSDVHILNGHTYASRTVLLPDGKIMLTGTSDGPWNDDFALARLQSDGALDQSFHFDGIVTKNIGGGKDFVMGAALQSNGRVVMVGNSAFNSDNKISVARFLTGYSSSIGINEHQKPTIKLYPNPTSDQFQIKLPENYQEYFIKIYSLSGQLLFSDQHTQEQVVDISTFQPGLYIVSLQTSDGYTQNIKLNILR